MQKMRRKILFAVLVAAAGVLAWQCLRDAGEEALEVTRQTTVTARPRSAGGKPVVAKSTSAVHSNSVAYAEERLEASEQKTIERIQEALDNEDLSALRKLLPHVRASSSVTVRRECVDALGWFGEKALVELTSFLSDVDSDVAQSAFNAWDSAVDQIDDEKFRVTVAQDVMLTLVDGEMVDNVSAKIKGALDAKLAVDAVLEILSKAKRGSAADKAARETYEFVTGEPFTDAEAAAVWLKENYTPPEATEH